MAVVKFVGVQGPGGVQYSGRTDKTQSSRSSKWKVSNFGFVIGLLVVLGLTSRLDSISVYIGPSPREEERREMIDERKK